MRICFSCQAADTGGCEGMGQVKGVRWNKKRGIWKVSERGEEEAEEVVDGAQQGPEEVSSSRVRESLTMYEETFRNFPHAALLQRAMDSRTQAPKKKNSKVSVLVYMADFCRGL